MPTPYQLAGKNWSLQEVENYMRSPPNNLPEDPRLHAGKCIILSFQAIVCASISCPDVRKGAYSVENVDEELTDNFNRFLQNPKKGMYVDQSSGEVTLSEIFYW